VAWARPNARLIAFKTTPGAADLGEMSKTLVRRKMRGVAVVVALIAVSATPVIATGGVQRKAPGTGGSLTLRGLIYGSTARITLLRVIDPATPSYPSRLHPRSGDRWVAVQLKIRGLGGTWTDVPANDGRLIDSLKRQHRAFPPEYGTVEPRMPPLDLEPGRVQVGNLVFELPKSARPRTFKYVISGGNTGAWDLTR
jgi:hypothetical protein